MLYEVITLFLRDPDFKVPFRIAYEGSDARYLTGADFDPESIQLVNGEIWIGEEFGPVITSYSIHYTKLYDFSCISDSAELNMAGILSQRIVEACPRQIKTILSLWR